MNKHTIAVPIIALLCCLLLVLPVRSAVEGDQAEEPATSASDWWVISSGGGLAGADEVALVSTLGQPIIGFADSVASDDLVTLGAGYQYGNGMGIKHGIYLPLVLKNV